MSALRKRLTATPTPQGHAKGQLLDSCPLEQQDPWNQTLATIATGDRAAFADLFRHFAPRLRAFGAATPMVDSPSAFGDELAQDVMISVWQKASMFDPGKASATTWIFSIARNRRIDLLRKRNRRPEVLMADDMFPDMPDDSADPFTLTQEERLGSHLQDMLDTLPAEQAEVLNHVYVEGKTHSEVAEELGLPLGTVKSRIRLALQKMKVDIEAGWQP
ncbi:MAG: sigma-70 family RNA polymerase sigma factor [Gammaproteobacteria bacterium]|nr:MAG: sigma-70 family RNA polymerase sigma factor [Gammaproteobacteria bacterium]